jgi:Cu+-exporting ATPase
MPTFVAEKTPCYHCGETCPPEPVRADDHAFCCEGCRAVYQLLAEHQLCQYYRLEPHAGQSPKAARLAFLDAPDVAAQLLDFQNETHARVTFYVPAIHCTACLYLLEHLPRIEAGVRTARVDVLKKHVAIEYDPRLTTLRTVAERLTDLGYAPLISLRDVVHKARVPTHRRDLLRLAVAGFCAGNIMLLSLPEYLGLDEAVYRHLFGYLSAALAVPVVFYSGWGYFMSAYESLRRGRLNIDAPILLGILVAFFRSLYDVFVLGGAGYFDSLTGLTFFLLTGQWFQRKTYDFLAFDRDYKAYFPLAVARLRGDAEEFVPVAQLRPGDRIRVRHAELIPADGLLYRGTGQIDYSFVTGEASPERRQPGDLVYAGGRQLGEALEIELTRDVSQSYLTQLWNHDAFRKAQVPRLRTFADGVARHFTTVVLLLAAGVGAFWWTVDSDRALHALTAVLIIACPCALSLAYPVALGHALRQLGRRRLYLKRAEVVETLAACDTVVFDKTGTLTRAEATPPRWQGTPLTDDERNALTGLARQSTHPVARRLSTLATAGDIPVTDLRETPGQGLEGTVAGYRVRVGNRAFIRPTAAPTTAGTNRVYVRLDGVYRGWFEWTTTYREGALDLLRELRPTHRRYLLSGDQDTDRTTLRAYFDTDDALRFGCQPADKLQFVRDLQQRGHRVLFVGDGLNDAGALQQADVGLALTEDALYFTPASDAILDATALADLPVFLRFSRYALRVIRVSFAVSLVYNFIGLAYAVTGTLSPVVAAILMPLSSATMVLLATLGVRAWRWPKPDPSSSPC